jgi:DNA-binding XRE family transcriptional regulator
MPTIIRLSEYNPLPAAEGWGERLVRCRTSLRLSQRESAKRLGINPSTQAKWERGEREPAGLLLGTLNPPGFCCQRLCRCAVECCQPDKQENSQVQTWDDARPSMLTKNGVNAWEKI